MVLRLINKIKSVFIIKLKYKANVILGKNIRISKNVLFDCKYGGKIIIGADTEIMNGVLIMTYGGNITIGKSCSINPYTILYGHGNLIIGDNVLIAAHCVIIPANHNFSDNSLTINKQGLSTKGITIKDNVWIGTGCRILDGVTIGQGAIIAAGAVVNKNVEEFTTVGGVPSKLLKDRN